MDALKGATVALVSSLLASIVLAYLFRIPIPMEGMIGPFGEFSTYTMTISDVLMAVFSAWIFYGMFGGFIVLLLCGAVTGLIIGRKYSTSNRKNRMIVLWSSAISTFPVLILSTLDYIMGPW
jgi:hypothetical protein